MSGFSYDGDWVNGNYVMLVYNFGGEMPAGTYDVLNLGDASVIGVTLSTRLGCLVNSVEGTLDVNDNDEINIAMYPVPAKCKVTITGAYINSVVVYNTWGQMVVAADNVRSEHYTLDVANFAPGNYIVKVITETGVVTRNVIVSK